MASTQNFRLEHLESIQGASIKEAQRRRPFELIELMSHYCYCSTLNAGELTPGYGIRLPIENSKQERGTWPWISRLLKLRPAS